jgi:hypothetical protein
MLDKLKMLDKRLVIIVSIVVSLGTIWTFTGLPNPIDLWDVVTNKTEKERLTKLENISLVNSDILKGVLNKTKVVEANGDTYFLYRSEKGTYYYFVDCCQFYSAIKHKGEDRFYFIDFKGQYHWCSDVEKNKKKPTKPISYEKK